MLMDRDMDAERGSIIQVTAYNYTYPNILASFLFWMEENKKKANIMIYARLEGGCERNDSKPQHIAFNPPGIL